jgi:Tol biopolymer transport system component
VREKYQSLQYRCTMRFSPPALESTMLRRPMIAYLVFAAAASLSAAQRPDDGWPEPAVLDSRVAVEGGGRVDWSAQGDRLVFDRADATGDGLFDVFVLDLGSGAERCLTCTVVELRGAQALDPTWHPSGDYVAFQVQKHARKLRLTATDLSGAASGLHADIWLVRSDGKDLWQLTRADDMGSAVLAPHFSHEGDRLMWSERAASRPPPWGAWQLRTATLQLRRSVPSLKGLDAHRPDGAPALVVAEGFMPDDKRLLFAAERTPGGKLGIGIFDPSTRTVERLTASGTGDDEHPRVSPRGDFLAWAADAASARGPRVEDSELPAREVWTMALDGSQRRPLTRFNGEGPEGLGRAWVGDLAFDPRGDRLAVQVVYGVAETHSAIVILQLDPSLRRSGG